MDLCAATLWDTLRSSAAPSTLAGQLFPQISYGGMLKPIVAPYSKMETKPDYVERYEVSVWRGKGTSLLDFLRKNNDQGDVIQNVKKAFARRLRGSRAHGPGLPPARVPATSPRADQETHRPAHSVYCNVV